MKIDKHCPGSETTEYMVERRDGVQRMVCAHCHKLFALTDFAPMLVPDHLQ